MNLRFRNERRDTQTAERLGSVLLSPIEVDSNISSSSNNNKTNNSSNCNIEVY